MNKKKNLNAKAKDDKGANRGNNGNSGNGSNGIEKKAAFLLLIIGVVSVFIGLLGAAFDKPAQVAAAQQETWLDRIIAVVNFIIGLVMKNPWYISFVIFGVFFFLAGMLLFLKDKISEWFKKPASGDNGEK